MKALAAVVLVFALCASCGSPWIVKETVQPRGAVIGWQGDAQAFMRAYCKGRFVISDRWEGDQAYGRQTFDVGEGKNTRTEHVSLQEGYYYLAFFCPDHGASP